MRWAAAVLMCAGEMPSRGHPLRPRSQGQWRIADRLSVKPAVASLVRSPEVLCGHEAAPRMARSDSEPLAPSRSGKSLARKRSGKVWRDCRQVRLQQRSGHRSVDALLSRARPLIAGELDRRARIGWLALLRLLTRDVPVSHPLIEALRPLWGSTGDVPLRGCDKAGCGITDG